MTHANDSTIPQRKLMDKLASPPQFGSLIGLLSTTYEMQPEFFETDYLPTVLRIGAWDDRSWTSRIEIERKLAYMHSATVFMDAACYRNRPRSLRVRIIPVALEHGRALHAKVTLLLFENAVRLIVGSANLTEPGYRENREGTAVLTVTEKDQAEAPLIRAALETLPNILSPWWDQECASLQDAAFGLLESLAPASPASENAWFVWGGGENPLWSQFLSHWPKQEPVQTISIVSPFWSDDANQTAMRTLIRELGSRHCLAAEPVTHLYTEAVPDTQTTYKPSLPDHYGTFDFRSLGVKVFARAVDPAVLREEVDMEGFNRRRPLHAKVIVLEGDTSALAYVGSANFTRRGWGFLKDPSQANVEAGIILKSAVTKGAHHSLLPPWTGREVELTGGASAEIAPPEPEPNTEPWPRFLREVTLTPSGSEERLNLRVVWEPALVKGPWQLFTPGEYLSLMMERSVESSSTGSAKIQISKNTLNVLLREQEVHVDWWESDTPRSIPINVALEARLHLPITPGASNPSERNLICYYQGRITWEELFPDPDGPVLSGNDLPDIEIKRGVDTSGIQAYQVREFVEALKGIHDDLRAASQSTEPAMRLALTGPVSPVALGTAVAEAVKRGGRTPVAGGFQLVEILACLDQAKAWDIPEKHAEAWRVALREGIHKLERLLHDLRSLHENQFPPGCFFEQYEQNLRSFVRKEPLSS